MIHLRGCWLANNSKRSEAREYQARQDEIRRKLTEEICAEIESSPILCMLIERHTRHKIHSNNFRATGETA